MLEIHPLLVVAGIGLAAYAAGSVNFSILAARIAGLPDPRTSGSGNAGATNLSRAAGWPAAAAVLALDVGRAFLVVFLAEQAGSPAPAGAFALPLLLGNTYPAFHRFRGGKGVATSIGALLAAAPTVAACGVGAFLVAFAATRRASVGSLALALSYPASAWLLGGDPLEIAAAGGITLLLVFTHRANIRRLARGEEPPISLSRESRRGDPG